MGGGGERRVGENEKEGGGGGEGRKESRCSRTGFLEKTASRWRGTLPDRNDALLACSVECAWILEQRNRARGGWGRSVPARGGQVGQGKGKGGPTPSVRLSQSGTGRMARFSSCPRSLASGRAPVKVLRVSRSGCRNPRRDSLVCSHLGESIGFATVTRTVAREIAGCVGCFGSYRDASQRRTCPPSARKKNEKNSQASCC